MTLKREIRQQYICPKCGIIGAGSVEYWPLCHGRRCNYTVRMLPSRNGWPQDMYEWIMPSGLWVKSELLKDPSLSAEQLDYLKKSIP